ncbi:hypothetical protein [Chondromyces apiculatus]|nr:hypothetical protein [Chondromyces apiculatus]
MSQQPMTDAERQALLAQYKDLHARAEAAARDANRVRVKPARLALTALAILAIGVVLYLVTDSVVWALLGTLVGLPVVVLVGVVITATISHSAAERERKLQVPVGSARVIADPRKMLARVNNPLSGEMPTGDRLALWLCCYLDYCVVNYNAKRWAPSDPGSKCWPQALAWLSTLQPQLAAGANPAGGGFDFGNLGGWQPTAERLMIEREVADAELRIVRGTKGYTFIASEPMGNLQRGDIFAASFPALAAQVLASGQVDPREVCSMLLAQCAIYQARGNTMPSGEVVNEALAQHPAFAARLATVA